MDSAILKKTFLLLSMPLFEIGGNKVSIFSLVLACLIIVISIKLSKVAQKFIKKALAEKEIDSGIKGSIERIVGYLVILIGTLMTLDTVGISLSSLAAIGAVLMVGIGFGLQNITQNFISGLIILLERPVKVGDLVEVDGISGRIIDIRARSTIIHTRDDIAVIVPNSQFISKQVVNESYSGEKIRLSITVGVAYGSDLEKVKNILMEVAQENNSVLQTPMPRVFFTNFGDSSLDFRLAVWVKDIWFNEVILSDLRFSVDKKFREQAISIPFPQRDVHLKSV